MCLDVDDMLLRLSRLLDERRESGSRFDPDNQLGHDTFFEWPIVAPDDPGNIR